MRSRDATKPTLLRILMKVCKMQKSASSKSWLVASVIGLSAAVFATHALADCDDDQQDMTGKAVAVAAAAKVSSVIPGSGKQMINLDSCDVEGTSVLADFKYNVIGSDGLYWVQGKAKVSGKIVQDLKITGMSPNLAAASAKAGVKLASN